MSYQHCVMCGMRANSAAGPSVMLDGNWYCVKCPPPRQEQAKERREDTEGAGKKQINVAAKVNDTNLAALSQVFIGKWVVPLSSCDSLHARSGLAYEILVVEGSGKSYDPYRFIAVPRWHDGPAIVVQLDHELATVLEQENPFSGLRLIYEGDGIAIESGEVFPGIFKKPENAACAFLITFMDGARHRLVGHKDPIGDIVSKPLQDPSRVDWTTRSIIIRAPVFSETAQQVHERNTQNGCNR